MTGLLAASMVAVVLYCSARTVVPALRPSDHGRDLDAWHVVMAVAMAAMLLLSWAKPLSVVALVVFAVGLGWALLQAVRRAGRAAYLRLGVGCAAMGAMLLPMATASAAPAAAGTSTASTAGTAMDGMGGMGGMDMSGGRSTHPGSAAALVDPGLVPPTAVLGLLLAALGVLLVVRLRGSLRAAGPVTARLDACCDVAMAGAMGYMLAMML